MGGIRAKIEQTWCPRSSGAAYLGKVSRDHNRHQLHPNVRHLDRKRSQMDLNHSKLNFNCRQFDHNRSQMDPNHRKLSFSRGQLAINRRRLDLSQYQLNPNRRPGFGKGTSLKVHPLKKTEKESTCHLRDILGGMLCNR
mmetsp:Transcript_28636/g.51357  ORF Transcript_28636/g.51357 Transcript_28636/m.51357 type:complete len:139 (+) Transcript_28636:832-1248(+)